MKTGDYQIFRKGISQDTEEPEIKQILEVKSSGTIDDGYWFGESIGIIEYVKWKDSDQVFLFMSENRHDQDISNIICYEILINV